VKCPRCGGLTLASLTSNLCPDCHESNRSNAKPNNGNPTVGCLTILIVTCACGVLLLRGCSVSHDPSKTTAQSHESASTSPKLSPEQMKDAKSLDEAYGIQAGASCSVGADDYLRSIAKYDFKWDDGGFFDVKFDKVLSEVSEPGVLTLATNKVSLQNGFGAFQRTTLLCKYDTQAKTVLKYEILPNE
jgi:hypothetical protein